MNLRPSELYRVTWPLAAFYLDRGLAAWATFVETKMEESASAVANTVVGRGSSGQTFIQSARKLTFAKLLGLPETMAFANPQVATVSADGLQKKNRPKSPGAPMVIRAEGDFDLSKFNG